MRIARAAPLVASLGLLAAAHGAETNFVMSHGGRLFDADDKPVEAQGLEIAFRIFALSAPVDGEQPLWTGAYTVNVTRGYYSLGLGGGAHPLPVSVFPAGQARYLEIAVGGATMAPRLLIGTMPQAANAATLSGTPIEDLVLKSELAATAYTRAEVDAALAAKAAASDLAALDGALGALDADVYRKQEVDGALAALAGDVYTKGEVDGALATLAGNVYDKQEVDGAIAGVYGDVYTRAQLYTRADLYTKAEIDALLDARAPLTLSAAAPDPSACTAQTAGRLWDQTSSTTEKLYVCNGTAWKRLNQSLAPTPVNLVANAVSSSQIDLGWDPSPEAERYKVFGAPGAQALALLATVIATSYSATGLAEGTSYTFRVAASNSAGDSGPSEPATAYTQGIYGFGADGALAPTGTFDLNTMASGSRSQPDGVAYRVTANPATTSIEIGRAPSGFAAGDRALVIALQGDFAVAGNYEVLKVTGTTSTAIAVQSAPALNYLGSGFGSQRVVVQRVPQYASVTLDGTDVLTASAWDGLADHAGTVYTGVVALYVQNGLALGGNGIDVSQKGFRGGAAGGAGPEDARNPNITTGGATGGSGTQSSQISPGGAGAGTGNGGRGGNGQIDSSVAPGGAGGRGGGGGAGNHSNQPNSAAGGGAPYDSGANYASSLLLTLGGGAAQGAGGGGGGAYGSTLPAATGGQANGLGGTTVTQNTGTRGGAGGNGGPGGRGGGIVLIRARLVSGSAPIAAGGGAGGSGGGGGASGHYAGGGGGGGGANGAAGGSVFVRYDSSSWTGAVGVAGGNGGGGGGGGGTSHGTSKQTGGGGGGGTGGGGGGGAEQNGGGGVGGRGGDAGLAGANATYSGGVASAGGGGVSGGTAANAGGSGINSAANGVAGTTGNGGAGGRGGDYITTAAENLASGGGGGGASGAVGAAGFSSIAAQ